MVVVLGLFVFVLGCGKKENNNNNGPVCGNGTCEQGETTQSCPGDCPVNPCGNGTCEQGETYASCPADCPESSCGNGTCDTGETYASCPSDCSQNTCGNGTCDQGETNSSCPADCPLPQDNPPTVQITSPANGSTVSGTILIQVNATDDKGISSVQILVNGGEIANLTNPPYEVNWDTHQGNEDQSNSIKAIAKDTANQTAENQISVIVDNNPPSPYCGDGTCNGQENCSTCSSDCGSCPPVASVDLTYVGASPPLESGYLLIPMEYDGPNPTNYQVQATPKDSNGSPIPGVTCTLSFGDSTTATSTDLGGNKFQLKTLKDWFNMSPNAEPTTTVKATCQGVDSNVINIKSIINLGKWTGITNSEKWQFGAPSSFIFLLVKVQL